MLVFTAPLGGPLRFSKWTDARHKKAIPVANERILATAKLGERPALLPRTLRVYDLRHTCASLMIAEGASIKAVQAQLGHKTATMTLDLYGHLFPDETERLAEQMDRARAVAVAGLSRTENGPAVVPLRETAGQTVSGSAEEVGFEPTGPSRARRLSRSLPSAARPLLRDGVYRPAAQRLAGSIRSVPLR